MKSEWEELYFSFTPYRDTVGPHNTHTHTYTHTHTHAPDSGTHTHTHAHAPDSGTHTHAFTLDLAGERCLYFRQFRFRSLSIHATAFLSVNQFAELNYQPSFMGPPRVLGALRAVCSLRMGSGGPG